MAILKPFCGLRPKPELASAVAALPYDVMNSTEARAMAAGNPNSFLHVSKAEIDLPADVDVHSPAVYQKAKENFEHFISSGILVSDSEPCLYIYAQVMDGRRQVGLVASSSIEDYWNDVIKKHEFTRPEKEQDRIEHMLALQAQVGPIFLTYPQNNSIDKIVNQFIAAEKPAYDFTAEDGIQHTVWVLNKKELMDEIISIFSTQIPFTYIADGHHRTASAAKVGQQKRANNPAHTGEEEYNFFLSVLFPDNQLAILDYNRVVKDLNGHSAEDLINKIMEKFDLDEYNDGAMKPEQLHQFGMYLDGRWYQLTAKAGIYTNDPIGILDITILQENILTPLLGINDPRTSTRIDFVGGIRGMKELERRVNSGEMAIAFSLYPVSLEQLMNIADSGNVMPPKSTWFEPKLRDGLLCHLF